MKLNLEQLESRETPAVYSLGASASPAPPHMVAVVGGVTLNNGLLSIVGTNGNDIIGVSTANAQVSVSLNGKVSSFTASTVTSLSIAGLNGNDLITNGTALPAVITDGNGADVVFGGSGND